MNSLKNPFFCSKQWTGSYKSVLLDEVLFPLDLELGAALQDWSKVYLIISVSNIYKILTQLGKFCSEMVHLCVTLATNVFKLMRALFSCQRAQ